MRVVLNGASLIAAVRVFHANGPKLELFRTMALYELVFKRVAVAWRSEKQDQCANELSAIHVY